MDNELYLIHRDDYLGHIDDKLEMYDLMLELVRALRKDMEAAGNTQALRTLCHYEQMAHETYEGWYIPDEYRESGDPDDLSQLMENELLPVEDEDSEDEYEEDGGGISAAFRLLRAVQGLKESACAVLAVASDIVDFEEEIDRLLDGCEGPENACAE